jgi:hypothetical protein
VADFLSSGVQRIASGKFKNIFEGQIKYGIQFIPVEIKDNKGEIISGHYAFHIWNRLRVIDKNNYVGSAPNRFGNILRLEKFSLDPEILKNTTLEKRLVFGLDENNMIMIHQNVYEVLQAVNLTGLCFFRVDKWDDGVIPR